MVRKFDIDRIKDIENIEDVAELEIFYYLLSAVNQDHEEENSSPYYKDLELLESKILALGGFEDAN